MKITKSSFVFLAASSLAVFGLAGCEQKKSEPVASVVNTSSSTSVVNACGVAPAGELVAERIPGANSTRAEPSLYEGPVWIKDALYFSDFLTSGTFPSRIQKLDANGVMTTLIDDSGSNGLAVDAQGNLVAGAHKFKNLSRYTLSGERTSVIDKFEGNVFNSPNDLAIAKDGTIYFTDPAYQTAAAPGGQDKTRVYRVATDGKISVVDDTINNPNGVSLSLDEKTLYVEGGDAQGVLRAYPIVDGIPQAGKDLVTGLVIPDGMALDCHGNIYITEHAAKHVRVVTPEGKQIATINVDANITNAAFGGEDGKTLFLTGAGAVWKLKLDVSGSPY
ncbi:gluconolactonase [Cellvibrio zantedeschiae]|uniref:Gluconolactonase n=1 Tax=Cellvibrio zantedeschiae TaxID=1237077 RepID=A0ABQ3B3H7_9GAMM|nr:SMP-30/gluconolactonase/LRE family protein [Cellvibrio zantedeschiae]GGY72270.1 gluconolactonase [Cellvibrio zantedeschiae]